MENRRKAERWYAGAEEKNSAAWEGVPEDARILDISVAGMRISSSKQMDPGAICSGAVRLPPGGGPFFIRGTVVRAEPDGEYWISAVAFDKVSALPLG